MAVTLSLILVQKYILFLFTVCLHSTPSPTHMLQWLTFPIHAKLKALFCEVILFELPVHPPIPSQFNPRHLVFKLVAILNSLLPSICSFQDFVYLPDNLPFYLISSSGCRGQHSLIPPHNPKSKPPEYLRFSSITPFQFQTSKQFYCCPEKHVIFIFFQVSVQKNNLYLFMVYNTPFMEVWGASSTAMALGFL